MFLKPAEGRYTSPFGWDTLQGEKRWHNGVDIAQSGMVPIHAAEDGTVVKSYLSTSYGECIIIEHWIDGQRWQSLYAHMRSGSRGYHVGSKVKRGSIIGYMGNTGVSTGQHLHFELHKGAWNRDKTDAVDPKKYFGDRKAPAKAPSVKGKAITIKGVNVRAIVQDRPDREKSKTLGYINKGETVAITGSVKGKNNSAGYWEIHYKGRLGYISGQFGKPNW